MPDAVLGIDVGTSGVRAVALDASGQALGQGAARMAAFGSDGRDPALWWRTTQAALGDLFGVFEPARIVAIAVDGTSGTVLPVDAKGRPLAAGVDVQRPGDGQGDPRLRAPFRRLPRAPRTARPPAWRKPSCSRTCPP
jgi:sugar (pentulose or hexulose) kinase